MRLCCVIVLAVAALQVPAASAYAATRVGDWASQNAHILSQTYGWDTVGNLTDRSDRYDATNSVTENFGYDALNRLVSYQTSSPGIPNLSKDVALTYNAIGNILSKSDVGTYSYPPSGAGSVQPAAVSSIAAVQGPNLAYTYDASGRLKTATGGKYSNINYTSFNLPTTLDGAGGISYQWQYGPGHQRLKEQKQGPGVNRTTWYHHLDNQGGLAYEYETGNTQAYRYYVSAMGRTIMMFEANSMADITKTQWWHTDHLGSVVAITNEANQVMQRFSYDPFGKRRQINGTYDATGTLVYDHPTATDRGFTGHEHLDDVGVIYMNGRTYDPHIGRFMQADPYIQFTDNNQSYNRYSYVLNNPLNAADPSGHFIPLVYLAYAAGATVAARAVGIIDTQTMRQMLGIIATLAVAGMDSGMFGGAGCMATGAGSPTLLQATIGGMAGGAIACGAECAATGAISAGMFHGIGQWANGQFGSDMAGQRHIGRAIAHGVGGCVVSEVGGGSCGHGAATAFLGKAISANMPNTGIEGLDFARAAVVGGTLSAIGGGKFANGAQTGAFQYLFNYCSGGNCTSAFEQAMYDWWPGYKAGTLLYNQTMGDGSWSGWEILDAVSVGAGVAAKGAQALGTVGREIQLADGFYQAEGSAFKFSKYYYERLWNTGRGAPFLQAKEVLSTATNKAPDRMAGFYRYSNSSMEMVYNPTTKEVWHLQPLGKK